MFIYHIPSVFFSELVERDRGFRMILILWLVAPRPKHTESARTSKPRARSGDRSPTPQLSSDHSLHWFESSSVLQSSLSALSPVMGSSSRPRSCSVQCECESCASPVCSVRLKSVSIPHSCCRKAVGGSLSDSLSPFVSLHLSF